MKTLTKKKNFLLLGAGMLSLAVAGSVGAITASAAGLSSTGDDSGTVQISYTKADAWSVTLPQSMTIGTAAEISASGVDIEAGKSLKVKVTSNNYSEGWKLKKGESSIGYELKAAADENALAQAENLENNGEVLSVAAGTATGKASIKGEISGSPSTGGEAYTDTLTFTVTVE